MESIIRNFNFDHSIYLVMNTRIVSSPKVPSFEPPSGGLTSLFKENTARAHRIASSSFKPNLSHIISDRNTIIIRVSVALLALTCLWWGPISTIRTLSQKRAALTPLEVEPHENTQTANCNYHIILFLRGDDEHDEQQQQQQHVTADDDDNTLLVDIDDRADVYSCRSVGEGAFDSYPLYFTCEIYYIYCIFLTFVPNLFVFRLRDFYDSFVDR